jgi:hypothetical protein
LRQNAPAAFPPEYYLKYLADANVLKKIGATSKYSECSNSVGNNFVKTGDVNDRFDCATLSDVFVI